MAFKHTNTKGVDYYLNTKIVKIGGSERSIYYFSKDERNETGIDLPSTHEVVESKKSGLPCLKKIK